MTEWAAYMPGVAFSLTYRITDGNVLTCEMDQALFRGPVVRTVKIKGSQLILSEDSRQEIYPRRE